VTVEALAHNAVIHRSDILTDGAVDALVDEASRLVVGYLRPALVSPWRADLRSRSFGDDTDCPADRFGSGGAA